MQARTAIAALLAGCGVMMASTLASAQALYFGAGFGSTDTGDGNAIPYLITSGTVDGKDSGFKIFGGFEFTPNFAVEMAYVDLGELTYSGSFSGTPVTNGRLETTGLNIAVVGTLPVSSSLSLFAKGGIFAWSAEARDITGGAVFVGRDEGGDLSIGLGAAFYLNEKLSLRAEWERLEANDGITLISAGFAYRF